MTSETATSDIRLAFAHPEERSLASASADPRDRISLRDHMVEVDIGAFQKERGHTQRILFNIVVEVRPAPQPLNDDVDRILSYDRLTEAIATELAAERLNLLETLAERVAERILAEPQAMRAFVRIEKLDVGPYKLGVEIVRSRAEAALAAGASSATGLASLAAAARRSLRPAQPPRLRGARTDSANLPASPSKAAAMPSSRSG